MKICYLGNARSIHTQRWVTHFAGRGHTVHLISLRDEDRALLPAVQLHPLRVIRRKNERGFPAGIREIIRGVNLISVILQVRVIVGRVAPDLVHAHSVSDNGLFAALTGFHPLVLTAWGSDILIAPKRSWMLLRLVQFVLKRADLITCDAEHLAAQIAELGASQDKIVVIFFGTDVRQFSPAARDAHFRNRLQMEADAPVVISLRSLNPLYDVESLVRAVPLVLRQVPRARFVIAGDGVQRDFLVELAASLGVANQVRFVGMLSGTDVARYLASADVYVSTALSDAGLAASTAEAMACALPVVITDFGANRQWVQDGEGGFLVPLRDPATLADRIVRLLQNEQARRRFGQVNRTVIEERSSREREMGKVERVYQRLVEEHRR